MGSTGAYFASIWLCGLTDGILKCTLNFTALSYLHFSWRTASALRVLRGLKVFKIVQGIYHVFMGDKILNSIQKPIKKSIHSLLLHSIRAHFIISHSRIRFIAQLVIFNVLRSFIGLLQCVPLCHDPRYVPIRSDPYVNFEAPLADCD